MSVTVKICGLMTATDADAAVEAGADYLGFVFFPTSRRCLSPDDCTWIRKVSGAQRVGVFRCQSASFIRRIADEARLDLIQLHGDEPAVLCEGLGGRERVVKSVAVETAVDWSLVGTYMDVARILFDTASPAGGGTGRTFSWRALAGRPPGLAFWIAGGLTPENVASAIATMHPAGVDVASGVERSANRKDADKLRRFVAAVRAATEN